jgi:hypothetical protein
MSRLRHFTIVAGGALLVLLGLLHDILGLPALRGAIARGEVAQRLASAQLVNWAFSGAAISLLGAFVLLAARELQSGRCLARRIIILTGVFFVLVGVAAYAMEPRIPVLAFSLAGLMLCLPLVARQRGTASY